MYHVISRGNRSDRIFPTDNHKGYFLRSVGEGAERFHVDIYAFCVMDSHYHLQVQINEPNLPEFMHYLGSSYASYLARNGWFGHIFAGRYKAILVDKEEYMLAVNRYIHLNPVSAAIVRAPEGYLWSSYPTYLGGDRRIGWLKRDWLGDYFGNGVGETLKGYREFIIAGMKDPSYYPQDKLIGRMILGGEGFVQRIMPRIEGNERAYLEKLLSGKRVSGRASLECVYKATCEYFGISGLSVGDFKRDDMYRRACDVFLYLARELTISPNKDIAKLIGVINANTASHRYSKLIADYNEDPSFRRKIDSDSEEVLALISRE